MAIYEMEFSPSPVQVLVRQATPSDAPAIHAITKEAFFQYAKELGLPGRVAALNETVDDVLRDIEQKAVFIALADDTPAGSIRCELLPQGLAYISRFGVKSNVQKGGLGRELTTAVTAHCERENIPAIALHTSAKMTSLVRFYYGQGFFIRSTETSRGYVRALLVKELIKDGVDYGARLI